ncbi:MAG: peptidoglycan DD-metalloendopeptidase family protein [Acidimicrobiia bacterium]
MGSQLRSLCVAALTLLGVVALAVPTQAQTTTTQSVDERLEELTRELGEVSAAEAAQLKDVVAAKDRREAAAAKVQSLDVQTVQLKEAQLEAEAELGQVSGRLIAIERGVRIAQQEADRSEAAATAAAQRLYVQNAVIDATPLEFAATLDDTNTALTAQHYLDVIQRQQRQFVSVRQQALQDLVLQKTRLESEAQHAATLRDRATTRQNELARARLELDGARADAQRAEEVEQVALAAIQTVKVRYEREIAVLRVESETIASQLGTASSGTKPNRLLRPVSAPITSSFGPRKHPIFGTVRNHDGIDFGAGMGTPIKAAAGGTVVRAGVLNGYGNVIVLDHGGGISTLYAHQSRFAVSSGERVAVGQVIGYVGSTGFSTGPHLHFEVRLNGRPVDPLEYL